MTTNSVRLPEIVKFRAFGFGLAVFPGVWVIWLPNGKPVTGRFDIKIG